MIALIVSITFVLLYNFLFFKTNFWGIGFGILVLFLNICFFLVRERNIRYMWLGVSFSAASVVFGFMLAWRANEIVQIINAAASLILAVTGIYFYKFHGVFRFKIIEILAAPMVTILHLPTSLFGLNNLSENVNNETVRKSSKNQALLNGLFLSIPIVGVLGFLLIQADPIFGKLTQDFLSSILERAIVSFILFIAILAFAKLYVKENKDVLEKIDDQNPVESKGYEFMVVLGSVAILFGIFILIQFQYLFSKPDIARLQEIGIASLTYSEYVRKGFFELLIVASIVIGLISFVVSKIKKNVGKEKILIQTFGGVVLFQTGLILWSDLMRLKLYADENGLTRARIFGFIFLIYLAYLLIIMLIELMQRINQKQLFAAIVPLTLVVLASLTMINIDGLIATRFKPTVNKEIDYFYISSLSADTYPVWKEALIDANNTLAQLEMRETLLSEDYRKLYYVRGTLRNIQFQIDNTNIKEWQAFNFGKDAARAYINDNKEIFNQVDEMVRLVDVLEQRVDQQIKMTAPLDRDVTPPLVN